MTQPTVTKAVPAGQTIYLLHNVDQQTAPQLNSI